MPPHEGDIGSYDNNGNQTSRGSDTFTFDHENRMTQSVVGGVTSSSVYYGDGVRKSHTVNGTTTTFKYDVLAGLPVVIQDGTYTYVYRLDLISMTDGSGNQKYFSYDGLGSVTDITNGSGTVTDTSVYDVFGAVTARTGTTSTVWKFTGEQADDGTGDSGYSYLRARYYDPATGRFTSVDMLEDESRYVYVDNNPATLVDLDGLKGRPITGGKQICGDLRFPASESYSGGKEGFNSFPGGTLVLMADGTTKPIEAIRLGDWVQATDPGTGASSTRMVIALIRGEGLYELVEIELEGGAFVTATAEHPFWVVDRSAWVTAIDLRVGDLFYDIDGNIGRVTHVHTYWQTEQVYNLSVEGVHTYYVAVGSDVALVHNCGGPGGGRPGSTPPGPGGKNAKQPTIPATTHGRVRLDQANIDFNRYNTIRSGFMTTQRDGARVYIRESAPNRYDVIVEGSRGVITAHTDVPYRFLTQEARNHGWMELP